MSGVFDPREFDYRSIEQCIDVGSPQHDGSQNIVDSLHVDRVFVHAIVAEIMTEGRIVPSMWNFEEMEIWEQLFDVIQDRSAGDAPFVSAGERADCKRRLRGVVLDMMSFVKDDSVEFDLVQRTNILLIETPPPRILLFFTAQVLGWFRDWEAPPDLTISREDHVVRHEIGYDVIALETGPSMPAQNPAQGANFHMLIHFGHPLVE
jgi:hypothetical protein